MKITVATLTGKRMEFKVSPSDSITKIQDMVAATLNMDQNPHPIISSSILFIMNGRIIHEDLSVWNLFFRHPFLREQGLLEAQHVYMDSKGLFYFPHRDVDESPKVLSVNKFVCDYNIREGSVLHMVLKLGPTDRSEVHELNSSAEHMNFYYRYRNARNQVYQSSIQIRPFFGMFMIRDMIMKKHL